ncbi:hypothetical protein SNEBB_000664 [Seison nebaliae]|nr:hypothetical protein SNEBB_000664 [Seison nebaliae]
MKLSLIILSIFALVALGMCRPQTNAETQQRLEKFTDQLEEAMKEMKIIKEDKVQLIKEIEKTEDKVEKKMEKRWWGGYYSPYMSYYAPYYSSWYGFGGMWW